MSAPWIKDKPVQAKKAWHKPVLRKISLTDEQKAKLFPQYFQDGRDREGQTNCPPKG